MQNKDFIKLAKEEYKKIGYVECPAFSGEKVYFNHYGLDHLIFKGRIPRPKDQVIERFNLLNYAKNIIKNTKTVYDEERRTKGQSHAYFWTIKHSLRTINIRIILRRLNDGTLHFFSIMKE